MTDFLKKTLYSCFVTKSYLIFLFKSINDTRIDNKIRLDFILSIDFEKIFFRLEKLFITVKKIPFKAIFIPFYFNES